MIILYKFGIIILGVLDGNAEDVDEMDRELLKKIHVGDLEEDYAKHIDVMGKRVI